MKLYVAVHGAAESGKSTACEVISQMGLININLADPLKRFAQEVFQLPSENVWGPSAARSVPLQQLGGKAVRHALQQLGTEWGRSYDPNVWVRYLLDAADRYERAEKSFRPLRYSPETGMVPTYLFSVGTHPPTRGKEKELGGFVVGDVRFPNEAHILRQNGYVILEITRPRAGAEEEWRKHSSENGLPPDLIDETIHNDGTLEEFKEKVRQFVGRQIADLSSEAP